MEASPQRIFIKYMKAGETRKFNHSGLSHNSKTGTCSIANIVRELNSRDKTRQWRQHHLPDGSVYVKCFSFEAFALTSRYNWIGG